MTAFQFRRCLQMHVLLEGNGYAYIDRDQLGRPLELIPLQPNHTYAIRVKGEIWYITKPPNGIERKLPREDVLHIKGLGFDGLTGYSVVTKARESLGLGMAMATYGSVFFRNGAEPRVVLEHPGRLKPEAAKNLRESWERMHAGLEGSHKTAILQEGMKASQLSMSAKDAQLIEQRKFEISEVALWFNLPPHKLGVMDAASYNSLEQENQDYLDDALDPWLVNWEQECMDKLLTDPQKENNTHVIEFERKALIRADMAARVAYYHNALTDGWMNRDEVREEEGYNPIPGGEGQVFLRPLNMGAGDKQTPPQQEGEQAPADVQVKGQVLEVPDIRQEDHYSCGAAASMAVGRYFGVGPETLQEWKDALGTDVKESTDPMAIVRYLSSLGLAVTAKHSMTLDELRRFWQAGQPVICPVQDYSGEIPTGAEFDYGHYLTVIGHFSGYVICQDSSIENLELEPGGDVPKEQAELSGNIAAPGRILIKEADWLKNWHDEDIDGNKYVQFGIAVGKELALPPPPEDRDTPDEDGEDDEAAGKPGDPIDAPKQPVKNPVQSGSNPIDAEHPRTKDLLAAQQRLLTDACRRIAKKIGTQARRQAKDGGRFMRWLDSIAQEHQAVTEEAFAPILDAMNLLAPEKRTAAAEAGKFLSTLRADLFDLSGKVTAKNLPGAVDGRMLLWESGKLRCGGAGSGVPGPCPDPNATDNPKGGDSDTKQKEPENKDKTPAKNADIKEHLEQSVKQMEQTPEGRKDIEKGKTLAQKVGSSIKEGAKAALNALDAESMGGVSLIAHGIKSANPKSVAAGAASLFNSVFKCVHEEVFEKLLSDSTGGPAIVAKLAAKVAAHGVVLANNGLFKAATWAMGKVTGGKRSMPLTQRRDAADGDGDNDGTLTDADRKLLPGLTDTAARAIRDTMSEIGVTVDADDLDLPSLQELLVKVLNEDKAAAAKEPEEDEDKDEDEDTEEEPKEGDNTEESDESETNQGDE